MVVRNKYWKIAGKSDRELLFGVGFGLNRGKVVTDFEAAQKDIPSRHYADLPRAEICRVVQAFIGIHKS